jgi:hypothetical protein
LLIAIPVGLCAIALAMLYRGRRRSAGAAGGDGRNESSP